MKLVIPGAEALALPNTALQRRGNSTHTPILRYTLPMSVAESERECKKYR